MKPLLFLLALFAFFFVAIYLQAQTTGNLEGKITDTANVPLPGAKVWLVGTSRGAITKVNGLYTIAGIRAGTYTVQVSYVGMNPIEKDVRIDVGRTTTFDLSLEYDTVRRDSIKVVAPGPKTVRDVREIGHGTRRLADVIAAIDSSATKGTITGKVLDEEGKPIPAAVIMLGGTLRGAITKPDGTFEIAGLQAGTYELRVSSTGWLSVEVSVRLDAGATVPVQITLKDDPDSFNKDPDRIRVCDGPGVDPNTTGRVAEFSRSDLIG